MRLSDLRPVAVDLMHAGITLVVESEPGRGKSAWGQQFIKWLSARDGFEWGSSWLFLATQTPTEMLGYNYKGERYWNDNGKLVAPGTKGVAPTAVTEPTLPLWMLTDKGKPLWAHRRGILFLEEYGQGEGDTKRASAQLVYKRELGPFRLPGHDTPGEGWAIIAFTNNADHRSGVTKNYDFVLNRVCWLRLTDDIVGTEAALAERNCLPQLLAFAHQHPEIVLVKGVPETQGPWMTPRSLEMASNYMWEAYKRDGQLDLSPIAQEVVAGMVGTETAMTLFNFVRLETETPSIEEIVKDPRGAPLPPSLDARYLVCFQLAHRVAEKTAEKVLVYIDRLGKEFAVTFAKAACGRMPMLAMTPAFTAWAQTNSSLMALMQQFR